MKPSVFLFIIDFWLLPLFLGGLIISCLAPYLVHKLGSKARFIILSVPLIFTLYFGFAALTLPSQSGHYFSYQWISLFDIQLGFLLDGLGLVFSLLISFLGLVIIFFGSEYLKHHRDLGRFYFFILLFMLSMLGLVLSDHLLVIFIFWEITTFSSFLLIGLDHELEQARQSAWQALLITTAGGLAMLAGFILIGRAAGTFKISEIVLMGDAVINSELYFPILLLILAGAFTKSAQFPFYFWLPGAMAAPTPVSAYLHSATMVKAGIYLLARLSPVLAGTFAWTSILTSIGAVTMLIGSFMSLMQDDLKLLLAYMTIMALGLLTLLLGIGSEEALKAAVVFLIVHSLYKGALFLVTGAIDHGTHTRKISELGGLFKIMPWTAWAALASLISMAGLPPVIGFIGKEMIYKATLGRGGSISVLILACIVLAKGISTALAGVFYFKVFSGKETTNSDKIHDVSWKLWGPPLLLGCLGVLLGLFPMWTEVQLLESSVGAIMGDRVSSKIFSGTKLDAALALSVLSTFLGIIIFLGFEKIKNCLLKISPYLQPFSPPVLYRYSVKGLLFVAGGIGRFIQKGYQIEYLIVIFLAVIFSLSYFLFQSKEFITVPKFISPMSFYEWGIAAIIVVSSFAAIRSKSLIAAVLLLGMAGYSVALLFVLYGAPDLALTQFLIETLTIILIALIAIKFPETIAGKDHALISLGKGFISTTFGLLMTLILWNIMETPFDPYLSEYFAENSYLRGKGRNIVNVILVDFRAFDTLGEITVLAVGSLGFFSLIKFAKQKGVK